MPQRTGTSLILITYNREGDMRKTLLTLVPLAPRLREILVIDNASTDGTPALLAESAARLPNLRVVRAASNLGVAGGRNLGIVEASGEILVFLDDDAEILTPDFADQVEARFAADPALGAMAFQVVNGEGAIRRNEFPHRNKKLPRDQEFAASYFVGAGHAIRAAALDEAGLYPEEFFYAQEELFLSYRILESGYHIVYLPSVRVLHWQSGAARMVNYRKWHLLLRNTLLLNHRFLPASLFWLSVPVWSLKVLLLCRGPRTVLSALRVFFRLRHEPLFERRPVSAAILRYVRKNGGRVFW